MLRFVVHRDEVVAQGRQNSSVKDLRAICADVLKHSEDSRRWQKSVMQAIHKSHGQEHPRGVGEQPPQGMSAYLSSRDVEYFSAWVLKGLKFQEIGDRSERIADAHQETFQWIFHEPRESKWSSFVEWLSGDQNLYWVTGKPGSGKSTLMKYIIVDERTCDNLNKWADGKELVLSSFYFWNSGTQMQMSREGLLRTLLHSSLLKCRDVIPAVFPEQLETYMMFGTLAMRNSWLELAKAFRRFLAVASRDRKLALFIDGLDEFNGEHTELITLIRNLLLPNVKVCVSSRPWNVFADAYGGRPNLMLQDLTYPDIKDYVESKFLDNRGFADLNKLDSEFASSLTESVIAKADGVFLWVVLVVRSLLGGLTDGDNRFDLEERLDSFPPDLEGLIWKILDDLGDSGFREASQIFQLVNASERILSLLEMWFAMQDDPEYAFKLEVAPLSDEDKESRAEMMRRRLNARTKGLLEAPHGVRGNASISYLHRTVRDFILRQDVWTKVLAATDGSFSPDLRLSKAHLILIKTADPNTLNSDMGAFAHCCVLGIVHAVRADPVGDETQVQLLDELDSAAVKVTTLNRGNGRGTVLQEWRYKHWAESLWGHKPEYTSLIHLAVKCRLYAYVKAVLTRASSRFAQRELDLLLSAAIRHDSWTVIYLNPTQYYAATLAVVELLLQHGANPNAPMPSERRLTGKLTTWEFMLQIYKTGEPNDSICRLLLDHGADPTLHILRKRLCPELLPLVEERMRMALKQHSKKRFSLLTCFGGIEPSPSRSGNSAG